MDHKELDRGDGWVVGFPATHPITFQSIYQSINGSNHVPDLFMIFCALSRKFQFRKYVCWE